MYFFSKTTSCLVAVANNSWKSEREKDIPQSSLYYIYTDLLISSALEVQRRDWNFRDASLACQCVYALTGHGIHIYTSLRVSPVRNSSKPICTHKHAYYTHTGLSPSLLSLSLSLMVYVNSYITHLSPRYIYIVLQRV